MKELFYLSVNVVSLLFSDFKLSSLSLIQYMR